MHLWRSLVGVAVSVALVGVALYLDTSNVSYVRHVVTYISEVYSTRHGGRGLPFLQKRVRKHEYSCEDTNGLAYLRVDDIKRLFILLCTPKARHN